MMPDVSGWDVYREMKAHEDTKDIPIIVVTVIEPHWSKKRGLDPEDVEGYLVKPFLPRALVDQVSRTVGQAAG
jgi:response regulator RpfG family c-di-GMP phosphodiesterase